MGPSTHAYGGTRMGKNPETNVVNEWGFSRGAESRHSRRERHGNERRPQSDADGASARLANSQAPCAAVENDRDVDQPPGPCARALRLGCLFFRGYRARRNEPFEIITHSQQRWLEIDVGV